MLVHLDADAFFASVEQAADSSLRNKAMAVGGTRRGIIASASYEARKMGVYTPMPTRQALRVCPHLIVVPGDYEKYELFSRLMFSYAYDFTPEVEKASIDEGYFDLSGNRKVRPEEAALRIRDAIADRLKIGVSEGIASNKLVSQIASKLHKPFGLTRVPCGGERAFLEPLPVKKIPGIGPKADERFRIAGIRTIGQLAEMPVDLLSVLAGKGAPTLRDQARGIDPRRVEPTRAEAKSYGHQHTFDQDTADWDQVTSLLKSLLDDLIIRLRGDGKSARTLSVKIRYSDMDESTRSESLSEPGDLGEDFHPALERLLRKAWDRRVRLRLASVRLTSIYPRIVCQDLFLRERREKISRVQEAYEAVRSQYGKSGLMRGWEVENKKPKERTG